MDWLEISREIFEVLIIPLLGALAAYIIEWVKKRAEKVDQDVDSQLFSKYLSMLETTVINCVLATNQTYVQALKDQNIFDLEAQKHAFELTYNSVMTILTQDAKEYLETAIADLPQFVSTLIEAQVNTSK